MTDVRPAGAEADAGTVREPDSAKSILGPISSPERISSIDVLRGFALLGLPLMNMVAFALPFAAYSDPSVAGGASGLSLGAWTMNEVFFEGTMRAIFSMLFGAGVILITSRAEARGRQADIADIYYRRALWLVAFGLVHGFVMLWPGDILYAYGLIGLFLFPFRKLSAKSLVILGLIALAVLTPKNILFGYQVRSLRAEAAEAQAVADAGESLTYDQKEALDGWRNKLKEYKPPPEAIEKTIKERRSGYWTNFTTLAAITAKVESVWFYRWSFWGCVGMMLLGMGLLKLGVFSAARSTRFYVLLAAVGYGIGLPLNVYESYALVAHDFDLDRFLSNGATYGVGRLTVALGHVAILMLICRGGLFRRLTSCLAAVGRMALSNYLSQTVISTVIFYGIGFGLFGKLERFELLYVVVAIWILQLIVSPVWLRYFRFGPAEWLWRSLTYWKRQPMLVSHAVEHRAGMA